MIISFTGKGGVGKTSLCALLLDELARRGYAGPVLAVDADPTMTLHLALGLTEPRASVADIRDTTSLEAQVVRQLPAGGTVAGYIQNQLQSAGVVSHHRLGQMPLDFLVMGQGEGPGCYCRVNQVLAAVLAGIVSAYRLVLIDNEAGLEHISRYRLPRADLLVIVATPGQAAQAVARRVLLTARQVGMAVETIWTILNQAGPGDPFSATDMGTTLTVPASLTLASLERQGQPVIALPAGDPVRAALQPLVEGIRRCV